jgi:hypothetical protein
MMTKNTMPQIIKIFLRRLIFSINALGCLKNSRSFYFSVSSPVVIGADVAVVEFMYIYKAAKNKIKKGMMKK